MLEILVLNDDNLDGIIRNSTGLILLEMYFEYSGISLIMFPLINRLQNKFGTLLKHYRLDVTRSRHFIHKYKLPETTTFLLFQNQTLIEIIDGLVPFSELERILSIYAERN